MTLRQRFWSKVNKFVGECWLWTGAIAGSGTGYGYFRYLGKSVRANRMAWILTYGPIPKGMNVLHHCDNTWCVNPKCLFLGTQKRNHEDKKEKGRTSHLLGEDSGRHKLKEKQVIWMRLVYIPRHPKFGARALARRFKVSHTAVEHALRGINWSYVSSGGTKLPSSHMSLQLL